MNYEDGFNYFVNSSFDELIKKFKNMSDYYKEVYEHLTELEQWKKNYICEYNSTNVYYENDNEIKSLRSVLYSSGTLEYDSKLEFQGSEYYSDGFGLHVERLKKNNYYYKLGAQAYISGVHLQTIYDVWEDRLKDGFIGSPKSYYNKIPVEYKGSINRDFKESPLYKREDLCLSYIPQDSYYGKIQLYCKDGKHFWKCRKDSMTWWKPIPNWIEPPLEQLNWTLKTIAASILATRVNTMRHLYLAVSHKKETPETRAIILSKVKSRLCQVQLSKIQIRLIEDILETYKGYTNNIYISWYYLPILSPLDSGKFCLDIDDQLSHVAL